MFPHWGVMPIRRNETDSVETRPEDWEVLLGKATVTQCSSDFRLKVSFEIRFSAHLTIRSHSGHTESYNHMTDASDSANLNTNLFIHQLKTQPNRKKVCEACTYSMQRSALCDPANKGVCVCLGRSRTETRSF